ncbi:hypothetical protein BCIN_15g00800 [Botrytis cinerea B05.10]|uniref:Uncharacterized protein n=1 Tax=Botryotinia fuckeliana (strain B05.10) TaxID=332648 RepID=A0A384K3U9_BOTFB|nr:hypothetical protein BCIN_15g00800 [Botrytis cinerea B05.10]ATZ57505.1 hypothetical protein BCIN_15g00800 [Botrytis cinerea B05.10]
MCPWRTFDALLVSSLDRLAALISLYRKPDHFQELYITTLHMESHSITSIHCRISTLPIVEPKFQINIAKRKRRMAREGPYEHRKWTSNLRYKNQKMESNRIYIYTIYKGGVRHIYPLVDI